MRIATHEREDAMPADRVKYEVITDDELDEREARWAEREGVDRKNMLIDDNGDTYAVVANENAYERLYVDYILCNTP